MQEKAQLSNTNEQLKTTATQKQEGSKHKQFQSPYKTREGKLGPIQSKQGRKPPIQAKQRPVNKSNPESRKIDPFEVQPNAGLEAYHQGMADLYGNKSSSPVQLKPNNTGVRPAKKMNLLADEQLQSLIGQPEVRMARSGMHGASYQDQRKTKKPKKGRQIKKRKRIIFSDKKGLETQKQQTRKRKRIVFSDKKISKTQNRKALIKEELVAQKQEDARKQREFLKKEKKRIDSENKKRLAMLKASAKEQVTKSKNQDAKQQLAHKIREDAAKIREKSLQNKKAIKQNEEDYLQDIKDKRAEKPVIDQNLSTSEHFGVTNYDAPWYHKEMTGEGQVAKKEKKLKEKRGQPPLGALPFTHNTDATGLFGILSTGQFLAGTDSVNYRYDLDSRYHQGISIVMRPHMEWLWPDIVVQDLYNQLPKLTGNKQNFGGEDTNKQKVYTTKSIGAHEGLQEQKISKVVRKHFENLDEMTNFRDQQVKDISKKTGVLEKGNKDNYKLSLVNPQIRIPKKHPIGYKHIEFVIMTKDAYNQICHFMDNPDSAPVKKVDDFIQTRGGTENRHLKADFAQGLKHFIELRKAGKIKVIDSKTGYSHQAGRLGGRSDSDTQKMEQAAQLGLEFGETIHHKEENNSPSALDMHTMIRFQEVFYKVLARAEGHRAQGIAQDRLTKREE